MPKVRRREQEGKGRSRVVESWENGGPIGIKCKTWDKRRTKPGRGRAGQKWEPGLPLKTEPSAHIAKLGEIVVTATLQLWQEESDRSVLKFSYPFNPTAPMMTTLRYTQLTQTQNAVAENTLHQNLITESYASSINTTKHIFVLGN